MVTGRITPQDLRNRIDSLDALRMARPLTPQERAEADALAHRLYMRAYRQTSAGSDSQRRRRARLMGRNHG
ncbi:MAG TPA: hypothetical protein VN222_09735 [Novosphingobium sp.]|nr:hypothetical protein [Novosphingobium sp.]